MTADLEAVKAEGRRLLAEARDDGWHDPYEDALCEFMDVHGDVLLAPAAPKLTEGIFMDGVEYEETDRDDPDSFRVTLRRLSSPDTTEAPERTPGE